MMAEWLASIGTWNLTLAEKRVAWSPGLYRICGLDPVESPPDFERLASLYHPTTATA